MTTEGFFDWLGRALGTAIRFIVEALSTVFNAIWRAMDDFLHGLARTLGMDTSVVSILLLVVGLLLLYAGLRAFLRRSIIGGIIWTFLGLVVLSWLIH